MRNIINLVSLRARLLFLVVLAVLPPIALTLHGAMQERERAIDVAESNLERLTGLAAASEARTLDGVRQFLVALSDVPDLLREPAACNVMLQTMLRKNTGYINLGVLDTAGNLRCSAVPSGNAVNLSDRANIRKTLATGNFATGEYVFGRVVRKHAINASYPIFDAEGRIVAILFAAIDLKSLDRFVDDIDLPANAIMVTADANGTIIARRPEPDKWIGTRAARDLLDLMVKVRFGTAEITGTDGIPRLHAFAPVGGPDLSAYTVSIGIPTVDIVAAANHGHAMRMIALMVTAALALMMAWFVANVTIIDRVRALVMATRRISEGDLASRTDIRYGKEEISELALAFDRMAHSLQSSAAERDEALARLSAEKERVQVTLESIGDAVITTDGDGRIDYLNPVAEMLTGWPFADARGRPLEEVFNVSIGAIGERVSDLQVATQEEKGRVGGLGRDCILTARDGTQHAIEDSAAPIRNRERATIGMVVVFHDVSHARNLARQLSHQASHDALTGLVNRREFERRLQLTLDYNGSQIRQHALLFLDLDRFKIVNDTCGHDAGDELLRQVSALLQPLLRDSDTLARIGGDEFGALLENCTPASAERIAEKLCRTVCDLRFTCESQVFSIGVSIGLVNYGANEMSMAALLAAADSACYEAKNAGRNRVRQFRPDMHGAVLSHGETTWRDRIVHALENDGFQLLSQTIRHLSPVACPPFCDEILLRMVDEQGMLISPGAFIPAAERFGLMHRVERWYMRHAFARHAACHSADRGQVTMCAVTVGASGLNDPLFADFLKDLFAEFSLPPASICFLIAETTAIAHLSRTLQFIAALKPLGCCFALDEFSTGIASFANLAHLGVDVLMIDGSFVADMENNPVNRAKVEAINHVSHAMNIRTAARRVEDQATIDRLRIMRVDYGQGDAITFAVDIMNSPAIPGPVTAPIPAPCKLSATAWQTGTRVDHPG